MATWTPETLPERYANTAEELQLVEATAATAWRGSGRFTGALPHA